MWRKEGYGSVLVRHGAVAEKIATAQHGHLMDTRTWQPSTQKKTKQNCKLCEDMCIWMAITLKVATYVYPHICPVKYRLHKEDVEESSFGNVLLSLCYYYDANNSAYLSNIQLSPPKYKYWVSLFENFMDERTHYLRISWMKLLVQQVY